MNKAFLSHSSQQKKYVSKVAELVGKSNCVVDEFDFEAGMKSIEEIQRGLEISDLFVIFLSDSALESDWVKSELKKAYDLLNTGSIKRIYPLIIDDKINYKDPRIPEWMRIEENYNIKYINRPQKAAKLIKQRLREIAYNQFPKIEQIENLFIGRLDLRKQFQERISRYGLKPCCLIVSGLTGMGRRSLLRIWLRENYFMRENFIPNLITLESSESIEDFILKTNDLYDSINIDIPSLLNSTMEEKILLAIKIVEDLEKNNEIIFIIDNFCIINTFKEISPWFSSLLDHFKNSDMILFALISKCSVDERSLYDKQYIFYKRIQELQLIDRKTLFNRLIDIENIDTINQNYHEQISELFTGYPKQILYSVYLLKEIGISNLINNLHYIENFDSEGIEKLISRFKDPKDFEVLNLLSRFPFIDYEFLYSIIGDEQYYKDLINNLLTYAVCEPLGAVKEFIRVNDVIRKHVIKSGIQISKDYQDKLSKHINQFLTNYQEKDKNLADIYYSLTEAIKLQKPIPVEYLIPSHVLNTIRQLYDIEKKYPQIIELSERFLSNSQNIEIKFVNEIQKIYCKSLARIGDPRFKDEIKKIYGIEHDLIYALYFRLINEKEKAVEKLESVIQNPKAGRYQLRKARKELIDNYLDLGKVDKALELAKFNYDIDKTDVLSIQSYLRCLIKDRNPENEAIINELFDQLERSNDEKSREIYLSGKAYFYAFVKHNKATSIDFINKAISEFTLNPFPILTKFDIGSHFNDIAIMKDAYGKFESNPSRKHRSASNNNTSFEMLIRIYILEGKKDKAIEVVDKNLSNYSFYAKEKLKRKIKEGIS